MFSLCVKICISTLAIQSYSPVFGQQGSTSHIDLAKPAFNDPEFSKQYYLNELFHVTMNIYRAWHKGYTGKKVTICISDPTGVDYRNAELSSKFVQEASYNFDLQRQDTSPYISRAPDGHGTEMAGLAAGKANNGICGVGVAYDASVSAVKIMFTSSSTPNVTSDPKVTAGSFQHKNQINDIYSCSWGNIAFWEDDIGYVHETVKTAIKNAAEKGRSGKGNIIVFAAGNGGIFNGTCGYNEYISSIYTIGISVITGKNVRSRQNVACSGVSAVVYSRDGTRGIYTQDDFMPTCSLDNRCITSSASSAAAAVASGIMALVLEANPNLGWRDFQHLIARSSCSQFTSVPWKTNGAGINVSEEFGFGLLDADALVDNAKGWKNVGEQLQCKLDFSVNLAIDGVDTLIQNVDMTAWPVTCGGENSRIQVLEHVVIVVNLKFSMRKYLEIEMTSPSGMRSIFLRSGRIHDKGSEIKDLSILSLHFWGENPKGNWQMKVRNVAPNKALTGILYRWSIIFYGTKLDPAKYNTFRKSRINSKPSSPKPTQSTRLQTMRTYPSYVTNLSKRMIEFSSKASETNSRNVKPTSKLSTTLKKAKALKEKLSWWAILLIVTAAIVATLLCVFVGRYLYRKHNANRGEPVQSQDVLL